MINEFASTIVFLVILLFSIVIHEVAHAIMAEKLGDSTARQAGRITLNPIPHLDFFGSFLLPGILLLIGSPILFGYAKPVPINPQNFYTSKLKYGMAKVAIAGPMANLAIALIFGMVIRFLPYIAFFPRVDFILIFSIIVLVNIVLALFNLLPIFPLDGSHILFTFLPVSNNFKLKLQMFGIPFLLVFIFIGGGTLIFDLVKDIFYLFTGIIF